MYNAGERGSVRGPEYLYWSSSSKFNPSRFSAIPASEYEVGDVVIFGKCSDGTWTQISYVDVTSVSTGESLAASSELFSGEDVLIPAKRYSWDTSEKPFSEIVIYYTFKEKVIAPSYVVTLPVSVVLTPDEGKETMSCDVNVGIKYKMDDECYVNVAIATAVPYVENESNERLILTPSKESMTWTNSSSGTTLDGEGNLVGSDKFTLTTNLEPGQWEGNLLVSISSGRN